ncbi:MAG: hypothetical protein HC781_21480, partial [Leptolyngbyaceae cyanobacterium CSU_1_4]|nr:hypothetical protein [Leptolyngbyaceae cyanobacterium CSU_1_4]
MGAVSPTSARLLAANANTRVYFQPNANYNGTLPTALTFRAWDTTTGTNGGTADPSINGSNTAFSTATDTAAIAVSPINDAPALTGNATLTAVNEDAIAPAGATIVTLFNAQFSDPDTGSSLSGVAVVGNTAPALEGVWEYSTDAGANWHAIDTVIDGGTALALSAATLVRFLPAANYNGTPTSLAIRALDDTYVGGFTNGATRVNINTATNGGATAIAAAVNTINTRIASINDAPVLTGSVTLTAIDEDILDAANTGTKVSDLINGLITDVDGDPTAIAITGVDNTKGVWQYSTNGGTTWTPIATTSDSNATLLGATSFYSANLGTPPTSQTWLGYTAVTIPVAGMPTPAAGTETINANGALVNTTADEDIYAGYSNYNTSGTLINAASPTLNATTGYSVSFDLQVLADANTNPNRAGFSLLVVSQDSTQAIELAFQRLSPTTGNIFAQNTAFNAAESTAFNTSQKTDYRVEVLGSAYTLFANNTAILTGTLRDYTAFTPPANFPFDPYEKPSLIFLGDDTTSAQGTFNLSQVVVQTDNRVRFVSNANENGSSTINFRAWDTTGGGTAGEIVDASVNGGVTPYSSFSTTGTIAINPINDAPTGVPTITGTATEDQTLTADASAIADIEGLGTFSYQWQSSADGTTWTDITGATATTFVLDDDQVGEQVRVKVSYIDDEGTPESINSAATTAIANINDIPTGFPIITGTATEDQTLTADASAIADDDGLGTFSYQWQSSADGTTWTDITGATATTFVLDDEQVGEQVRVKVSYIDDEGTPESINSVATATIANINDIPTGFPTITGTATEDQTLTADASGIADDDGLGTFSYQWQSS